MRAHWPRSLCFLVAWITSNAISIGTIQVRMGAMHVYATHRCCKRNQWKFYLECLPNSGGGGGGAFPKLLPYDRKAVIGCIVPEDVSEHCKTQFFSVCSRANQSIVCGVRAACQDIHLTRGPLCSVCWAHFRGGLQDGWHTVVVVGVTQQKSCMVHGPAAIIRKGSVAYTACKIGLCFLRR